MYKNLKHRNDVINIALFSDAANKFGHKSIQNQLYTYLINSRSKVNPMNFASPGTYYCACCSNFDKKAEGPYFSNAMIHAIHFFT